MTVMPPELEDKLATFVWYLQEVRAHRRNSDPQANSIFLDDPQVARWIDRMDRQNRLNRTRFISR